MTYVQYALKKHYIPVCWEGVKKLWPGRPFTSLLPSNKHFKTKMSDTQSLDNGGDAQRLLDFCNFHSVESTISTMVHRYVWAKCTEPVWERSIIIGGTVEHIKTIVRALWVRECVLLQVAPLRRGSTQWNVKFFWRISWRIFKLTIRIVL